MTAPSLPPWPWLLVLALVAVVAGIVAATPAPARAAVAASTPAPPPSEAPSADASASCNDTSTGRCPEAASEPPLATAAGDAGGGVVGGLTARAADGVFAVLVGWVVDGARWVIGEVVGVMDVLSRPRVTAGWFTGYLARMGQIAGGWLALLFLAAVIDGAVRGNGQTLLRAVLLLPAATAGTTIAVFTLELLIAGTDHAAGWLLRGAGADLTRFAKTIGTALAALDAELAAAAALVVGFALIVAGFVVWVELVLRDAAVYVAVLFLPLAFAGVVWPATAHWLGRLLRLIVAVVLSKLVIVAIVGLGATMLADGAAVDGLGPVIVGVGTLLLAGFAPVVLYRIVQVWDVEHTGAFHGALGGAVGRLAAPAVAGAVIASRFLSSGAPTGSAAAAPPSSESSGTPTAGASATGGPASTPPADGGGGGSR